MSGYSRDIQKISLETALQREDGEEEGEEGKKEKGEGSIECLCSMFTAKWLKWAVHPGKCCVKEDTRAAKKKQGLTSTENPCNILQGNRAATE